ncbi:MAG TPA: hypothetical protein VH969_12805 [Actinophytocola sp.]|uniref:hypothetical protein n=1 Tax=Actinophytocola sp. TaxID=1872138 RepID=UPI002F957977
MGTADAARSMVPVVQAGRDLRDALGDPDRAAAAVELLAGAARTSIAKLDRMGAEHAAMGVAMVPDDAEALLAATLSQLGVAGTMFAASEAVGEHGPAEPSALDEPLRQLDATVGMLTAPRTPAAQGIVALAASTTVPAAVASLERQLDRTVDDIVSRSTKVIGGSLTGIHDRGPAEVRKAWDMVNEKLHLDEFGGKLAKIGLRAFRGALALLARIVPAGWLTGIRAGVDRLIASVDERGPARAAVGMAIGADRLAALATLDQSTLDMAKLDRGTVDLAELNARYSRLMDMCGGIGTAIGVAAKLTVVLRFTIPQLGLLIMGAHLLVVAGVLVLGRDHIDAGVDPGDKPVPGTDDERGLVRGVRTILAEATA